MPNDDQAPTPLELSDTIHELKRAVEDLRAQLTAAQNRTDLTMRGQRRCPACGGREIYHTDTVLDRDNSGRTKMALLQPSVWRSRGAGEFEAYVCAACGKVEWYVKDPADLAEHLEPLPALGGDPENPPYR